MLLTYFQTRGTSPFGRTVCGGGGWVGGGLTVTLVLALVQNLGLGFGFGLGPS